MPGDQPEGFASHVLTWHQSTSAVRHRPSPRKREGTCCGRGSMEGESPDARWEVGVDGCEAESSIPGIRTHVVRAEPYATCSNGEYGVVP